MAIEHVYNHALRFHLGAFHWCVFLDQKIVATFDNEAEAMKYYKAVKWMNLKGITHGLFDWHWCVKSEELNTELNGEASDRKYCRIESVIETISECLKGVK